MKIEFKHLDHARYGPPDYQSPGAAGGDLRAAIDNPIVIPAHAKYLCPTGLAIHIASPGIMGIITPRSGLASKFGLVLSNTIGIIDSDYQGEIMLPLYNNSDNSFTLNPGERVAQMIFVSIVVPQFEHVTEFAEPTERGDGGFGSTGVE